MATAVPNKAIVSEPSPPIGEFEAPSYALRNIPMPDRMPKDDLGRDIAFLLASHPEIASQFPDVNLDAMTISSKVELLARVKSLAGIKPTRRRRLGYVGQ